MFPDFVRRYISFSLLWVKIMYTQSKESCHSYWTTKRLCSVLPANFITLCEWNICFVGKKEKIYLHMADIIPLFHYKNFLLNTTWNNLNYNSVIVIWTEAIMASYLMNLFGIHCYTNLFCGSYQNATNYLVFCNAFGYC